MNLIKSKRLIIWNGASTFVTGAVASENSTKWVETMENVMKSMSTIVMQI